MHAHAYQICHTGPGKPPLMTAMQDLTRLSAKTHPPRYLMHKYWSRKPHNIVRAYIEHYTEPGARVLDPFCGSGVTLAEALRAGRHAIGCDLNPMAVLISEQTCCPVSPDVLDAAFAKLRERVEPVMEAHCQTPCDACGEPARVTHTIWERYYHPTSALIRASELDERLPAWFADGARCHSDVLTTAQDAGMTRKRAERLLRQTLQTGALTARDEPVSLLSHCPHCKARSWRPLSGEERRARLATEDAIDPQRILSAQPLHPTACQSVDYVHELFTRRNLMLLGQLRDAIHDLAGDERRWMEFVFSSALSQASKLVFVLERRGRATGTDQPATRTEVGSWTVPNYWVPPRHYEINPWNCFKQRLAKVKRGKADSAQTQAGGSYHVALHSATDLRGLVADASIDYVFTDPPYGDAIPYLGISLMWATWLGLAERMQFERELHVSGEKSRKASRERYRALLLAAEQEIHRVLKPGAHATFCFNTNDAALWQCLDETLIEAGFTAVDRRFIRPARPSAKALLAPDGSMTGDVLVTVRKV